jgi:DNA repair protein RecO (recombination protein O)
VTTRVLLQPVFVLHRWPYRNSSLIVELFSQQYGRLTAVARSARGPQSRYKGYLQPFSLLLASWSGRRELMQLNQLELSGLPYQLTGRSLLCAFYLNELLVRLLPREDPYPEIFHDYQTALQHLEQIDALSTILRRFEKRLLEHLGYGLSFQSIEDGGYYQWLPEQGFLSCAPSCGGEAIFSGRSLKALQTEQWCHPEDLVAAKRLMRLALSRHLGTKPLKSRELFL